MTTHAEELISWIKTNEKLINKQFKDYSIFGSSFLRPTEDQKIIMVPFISKEASEILYPLSKDL